MMTIWRYVRFLLGVLVIVCSCSSPHATGVTVTTPAAIDTAAAAVTAAAITTTSLWCGSMMEGNGTFMLSADPPSNSDDNTPLSASSTAVLQGNYTAFTAYGSYSGCTTFGNYSLAQAVLTLTPNNGAMDCLYPSQFGADSSEDAFTTEELALSRTNCSSVIVASGEYCGATEVDASLASPSPVTIRISTSSDSSLPLMSISVSGTVLNLRYECSAVAVHTIGPDNTVFLSIQSLHCINGDACPECLLDMTYNRELGTLFVAPVPPLWLSTIAVSVCPSPPTPPSRTGVIVGSVAGGVVVLATAIFVVLLLLRRYRSKKASELTYAFLPVEYQSTSSLASSPTRGGTQVISSVCEEPKVIRSAAASSSSSFVTNSNKSSSRPLSSAGRAASTAAGSETASVRSASSATRSRSSSANATTSSVPEEKRQQKQQRTTTTTPSSTAAPQRPHAEAGKRDTARRNSGL